MVFWNAKKVVIWYDQVALAWTSKHSNLNPWEAFSQHQVSPNITRNMFFSSHSRYDTLMFYNIWKLFGRTGLSLRAASSLRWGAGVWTGLTGTNLQGQLVFVCIAKFENHLMECGV